MSIQIHPKPPSYEEHRKTVKPLKQAHEQVADVIKPLDRLACWITEHVGTMAFFLVIFFWTLVWCGYNILASEIPGLHWKSFDPFPAFVAYLLISNVIQILLMPLIMVGQNVQGAHSDKRAENDYEVNVKAEKEVELILHHLEYQNSILIAMLEKMGISVEEAKLKVAKEGADA